jgi:hypothetical protein
LTKQYNLNEKEREKYIKKKLDELANLHRTYIGAIERGGEILQLKISK